VGLYCADPSSFPEALGCGATGREVPTFRDVRSITPDNNDHVGCVRVRNNEGKDLSKVFLEKQGDIATDYKERALQSQKMLLDADFQTEKNAILDSFDL
jgi:hypothetical protein